MSAGANHIVIRCRPPQRLTLAELRLDAWLLTCATPRRERAPRAFAFRTVSGVDYFLLFPADARLSDASLDSSSMTATPAKPLSPRKKSPDSLPPIPDNVPRLAARRIAALHRSERSERRR